MHRRFSLIFVLSILCLTAYNQSRDLGFYLNEGIRNSPLLNDYRNQIGSATTDSLIITASRKPVIEAKSQLQYSPYYKNFGYDEVITDGGNYSAQISISQNIFNKKEVENRYNSAGIQKQLLNNSTSVSAGLLNKLITDQFLKAYSSFQELSFNTENLKILEKESDIVKQFVTNGVYKLTDYLSLTVEKQSQEVNVRQLQNAYARELFSLNLLCGITDTVTYDLVKPSINKGELPDISRSPSYIRFRIDSARIEAEKSAVSIKYKPKVNWFADAGILTSNPWNFYRHFGYSAGIGLNIPVYDGKQQSLQKEKLEFEQNSLKYYEYNYRRQFYSQIYQLNRELAMLEEVSKGMNTQMKTSEELLMALKDQLERGLIQMTDYINAIKNYRTINSNINQLNIQKLQIINELNFLSKQ